MIRFRSLAVPALLTAGLIAGCGSGSSAKSDSGSSSSGAAKAASSPAAASASAGGAITEQASDFKFSQTSLTAKAGKVKITLDNKGQAPHEFVVIKTDAAPDSLKVSGGKASEKGSVGEISETNSGASSSHTFDLKPGKYVFVCNVPGHYGDGMRGQLTVN